MNERATGDGCPNFATCCSCEHCTEALRLRETLRAACMTCRGDVERCHLRHAVQERDGSSPCAVYDEHGQVRAIPVAVPSGQPWDVRPARRVA